MRGNHETSFLGDVECELPEQSACMELASGGSVRQLERLASALRLAGDAGNTERVDQAILSLLEQKIYRKIMAQSRRSRRLSSSVLA